MQARPLLAILSLLVGLSGFVPGRAVAAPPAGAESADVVEARKQFVAGNELAKSSQWAQALAAFERSAQLRPHPLTTFNMAVCERSLGRLTRARRLFGDTIAAAAREPSEFPASRLEEANGYVTTIEAELVRLEVRLAPADAALSVDGRALVVETLPGALPVATAGLGAPGGLERAPAAKFVLVVDPGTHFFRVVAKGHADVTLTKVYASGARTVLDLELARLPATVHVTSNVSDPIVTVNGADVGLAPVAVSRPAGTYRVIVRKPGFDTFDTRLSIAAGQEVDLPARMAEEKILLTKRWWFWTAIGSALAGGAVLTYALTRESPAPPPYAGGTTGWVATPR
ncbi:hypothetical protein BH11MYX4_BH11MYX4_68940 [soil metagenome]